MKKILPFIAGLMLIATVAFAQYKTIFSPFTNKLDYVGVASAADVPAAGSDKQVQFNDGGFLGGADVTYDKTNHWLGIQTTPAAPLHVSNTVGLTVDAPSSVSTGLTLDIAVTSPSGSASQINGPDNPNSFSSSVYVYVDPTQDSGSFSNQDTGQPGFTANCQTINYTIYTYRNINGILVVNPNAIALPVFTDSICDGSTQFGMQIGNWSTPASNQDGFIVVRSDDSGTHAKDIGNNFSYTDNNFTDTQAYDFAQYPSVGTSFNQSLAQYKTIDGTNYRTGYLTNSTYDGGIGGNAFVIFFSSWGGAVNDGFYYQTHNGYSFNLSTGTSFYDWGQNSGSVADIGTFSSIAFPNFNTSLVGTSGTSAAFNYGSGSLIADGSTWDVQTWEYRVNPTDGAKYFVASPDSYGLGTDAGDFSNFSVGGSVTPGDGDGLYVVILKNGSAVGFQDIGNSPSFSSLDDSSGPPPSFPYIGSYSGLTRNYSAYGVIATPSTKYSATPGTYSFTDNNPGQGYIIQHSFSTYGNATGLKDIESGYRGPGNDYENHSITPSSYFQTFTGLGDATVTPSTLGYLAAGQTLTHHVFSKKTILATTVYSSAYATATQVFPNDGQYYTEQLTIAAVSGATYRINKVGTGWADSSSTSFQDDTSVPWSGSSTVTPTSVISTASALIEGPFQLVTDLAQLVIKSTAIGVGATPAEAISFQDSSNSETLRIGYDPAVPAPYIKSPTGIVNFIKSGDSGAHTRISENQLLLNALHGNYEMIAYSNAFGQPLIYADAQSGTRFVGINHGGTSPDSGDVLEVNDRNTSNADNLALTGSLSGNYIKATGKVSGLNFIVDNNAHGVFAGSSTSSSAGLTLGGQSTSVAPLVITNGSLKSSPLANSLENDGADFWYTNNSASRRNILKTGTTSKLTANTIPLTNSSGELIDGHITDNGSIINFSSSLTPLFQNGFSVSSSKSITMGGGASYLGGVRTSFGSISASTSLSLANHSPYTEFTGSTSGRTLTLPTAASISGTIFSIYNRASVSVTVATTSSQNINYGNTTQTSIILQPGDFIWCEATASSTWNAWLVPNLLTLPHIDFSNFWTDATPGLNWSKAPGAVTGAIWTESSSGANWTSQLSRASINWASLNADILAKAINWSDISAGQLQRAGVNWTDFQNDAAAGNNWAKITGSLTGNILQKTPTGVNWTSLQSLTTNRVPYGQGTTVLNSSANLTYDGNNFVVGGSSAHLSVGTTAQDGTFTVRGTFPQIVFDTFADTDQVNFEFRQQGNQRWTPYVPSGTSHDLRIFNYGLSKDNLTFSYANGDITVLNGNFKIGTVGSGLYVKTGTNATMGKGTLASGTATISTTRVTANSEIFITDTQAGVLNIGVPTVSAIVAGTSFTVTSSNVLDASTFNWFIVEPA